ncbi:hypothetical protein IG631_14725 [Alternaria alternata]|nr:hypothetical protein IG631_14725 [Alternaria alternata]
MHATASSILGSTSPLSPPITSALGSFSSAHSSSPGRPFPSTRLTALLTTLPKKQCHSGKPAPRHPHAHVSLTSVIRFRKNPAKKAAIQQTAPNTTPRYHHRHRHIHLRAKQSSFRQLLTRERLHRSNDRLSPFSHLPYIIDSRGNRAPSPRLIGSDTATCRSSNLPDPAIATTLSKPHLPPHPPTPVPMPAVATSS